MKKVRLKNSEIKPFVEDYDWRKASDSKDKKLFSLENEFNSATMERIFNQFDWIEISEDDQVFGVYSSDQKTLIAKAPYFFKLVNKIKEYS